MSGLPSAASWQGVPVLVTGHTGFKGGWLVHWLHALGAKVHGYALPAPASPNLFDVTHVQQFCASHTLGDVRDAAKLSAAVRAAQPQVVFHLAAQPLVRTSYDEPLETFTTNVVGTANLLDAVRNCASVKAVVVVTTDKCYEQAPGWHWPYRETDQLGGHDPYSASKACAELVTACYRNAFRFVERDVGLATVRAGNVIGGGDWTKGRLLPDLLTACASGQQLALRLPNATRPWQHVLDPLAGYLKLAERLTEHPDRHSQAWNFGPDASQSKPVIELVREVQSLAASRGVIAVEPRIEAPSEAFHEAASLQLDSNKARLKLDWRCRLTTVQAVRLCWEWHDAWGAGQDMAAVTVQQISEFTSQPE